LVKLEVQFGETLPTDKTVYTKNKDTQKYYINKTEVNEPLMGNMMLMALAMTSDNVALPVYEEVDIPAGTPLAEVLETLGVEHLYTDNENAAPKEPVVTPTVENDHYIKSYAPHNVCRVFQVTFCMKKKKW